MTVIINQVDDVSGEENEIDEGLKFMLHPENRTESDGVPIQYILYPKGLMGGFQGIARFPC